MARSARASAPSSGPWYAGHQAKLEAFDPAFVGKGNDQLGPGFYLTTDPTNARSYGPFVHEIQVAWRKSVPLPTLYGTVPEPILRALLDAVPRDEEHWQDFDEDPKRGYAMAYRAFQGLTTLRAITNLQGTFSWYRDDPSRVLEVLTKLGYTGFTIPAGSTQVEPSDFPTTWAVIWDPRAITITNVRKTRAQNPTPQATKKPRAPRKPIEGGKDWFEVFGPKGAPAKGQRGHHDPLKRVPFDVRHAIRESIRLFSDHEAGPMLHELLASLGHIGNYDGDFFDADDRMFDQDDVPALLEVPEASNEDALYILGTSFETLMEAGEDAENVPVVLEEQVVYDALVNDPTLRIVNVSKEEAVAFVEARHSEFPAARVKGLLYAIGAKVGHKLVAVALANTPSARFSSRKCSQEGIVDLSRIASDGTTPGASSMLAARIMDLLEASGRRGEKGCLLVTYSLLTEKGTTYLALAGKGLRPVGLSKPHKPSGARKTAGPEAKPELPKIVWESGPAANPPDWKVLERSAATEAQIAGAKKNFAQWEKANQKARYFWGSKKPFPVGFVLQGRPPYHGNPDDDDERDSYRVEALFEEHRPTNRLSRKESVFMVNRPSADLIEKAGGDADYIYEVEPVGLVEKNDSVWWADLLLSLDLPPAEHAAIAAGYFSGRPAPGPSPLFEYRAREAKILRQVNPSEAPKGSKKGSP